MSVLFQSYHVLRFKMLLKSLCAFIDIYVINAYLSDPFAYQLQANVGKIRRNSRRRCVTTTNQEE